MAMMCLGQFVFDLQSTPFQNMQHKFGWRHPSSSRVGLRPARQYAGPDDESITLSGTLFPEVAGDPVSLDELRAMADTGESWVLIDGTGKLMGRFVIESFDETRTVFFADGAARQIEFSLTLARVDDDDFVDETDDEIVIEDEADDDPFEFDDDDA